MALFGDVVLDEVDVISIVGHDAYVWLLLPFFDVVLGYKVSFVLFDDHWQLIIPVRHLFVELLLFFVAVVADFFWGFDVESPPREILVAVIVLHDHIFVNSSVDLLLAFQVIFSLFHAILELFDLSVDLDSLLLGLSLQE